MELIHTAILAIDAALCSLIWIVQVVVYPSFSHVDSNRFARWHELYTRRMGYIVAPLMIAQLVLSVVLVAQKASVYSLLHAVGVVLTWLVTFLISVPIHNNLGRSGNRQTQLNKLVRTNWIRTILWSVTFLSSYIYLNTA